MTLGSPHRGTLLAPLGFGRNAFEMRIGGAWLRELEAGDQLPAEALSVLSHQDNYVFPPATASRLEGARHLELGGVSHLAMVLSPRILGLLRAELEGEAG